MDSGQIGRIDTLYERVLTLFGERQVNNEENSGAAKQPEQKLKIIKDLLGAKEADAPLSYLEEKYVNEAAKWKAMQALDQMVDKKLAQSQREYYDALRKEIIEKAGGVENSSTLKKMAELSVKEGIRLSAPAMERARPSQPSQIIGQDGPMRALMGCLCTPFPQHVIIYGPPGVGKTSAARIALAAAKQSAASPFLRGAPFVETDGATLRYDRRGGINPLIGSVHDPIYQGASKELAGSGLPEPKTGLVSEAHGGVLFIDEIGEMDVELQNMLLKCLEDKRVFFDSPYYDPGNPSMPNYMRQLFENGAPADFVLIGATTRRPDELSPALRSRCAEVFFNPLEERDLVKIIRDTAQRMQIDITPSAVRILAGTCGDGRSGVRLLLSAHTLQKKVDASAVRQALDLNNMPTQTLKSERRIGHIAALGVRGQRGCVLPLEAVALPGEGHVELNLAAGNMARDAVRNAQIAIRRLGIDLSQVDLFLNVGGGGQVDGPSIGLAAGIVILSAVLCLPIEQDVAVSGEINLHGEVMPVGGLTQKRAAARLGGYGRILLPRGGGGQNCVQVASLLEAAAIAFCVEKQEIERMIAGKAQGRFAI